MLRTGLEKLGVDASCQTVSRKPVLRDGPCFSQIDRGEISSGGRKLIASAQRIFRNSVLQQSSISLRRPDRDIVEYLKTGSKSEISGRIVNSVAYLEEVLNETFSAPQIVEIYKGVFEAEMGQSGRLRMPENIEVKKSINIEK